MKNIQEYCRGIFLFLKRLFCSHLGAQFSSGRCDSTSQSTASPNNWKTLQSYDLFHCGSIIKFLIIGNEISDLDMSDYCTSAILTWTCKNSSSVLPKFVTIIMKNVMVWFTCWWIQNEMDPNPEWNGSLDIGWKTFCTTTVASKSLPKTLLYQGFPLILFYFRAVHCQKQGAYWCAHLCGMRGRRRVAMVTVAAHILGLVSI